MHIGPKSQSALRGYRKHEARGHCRCRGAEGAVGQAQGSRHQSVCREHTVGVPGACLLPRLWSAPLRQGVGRRRHPLGLTSPRAVFSHHPLVSR